VNGFRCKVRELNQRQIDLETEELEASRRREKRTGFIVSSQRNECGRSKKLADKAFENPQTAIDAIITEELGIDKEELGGSA
jgi:hypothetical protein